MAEAQIIDGLSACDAILGELRNFLDVPCHITIEFGRRKMTVSEILNLTCGSIVAVPISAGENVSVLANDKLIAQGEIITIEESMGVMITSIAVE
ncbi:MAG: FliM/FliN family flagellar motor switch protein [Acidobacteria bacterium]|nr:FliM/FliN family flagellar motor switch protein [Acidobacteriota bacterium]